MDAQTNLHFIAIDDDPVHNLICQAYLQIAFPKAEVQTFISPEAGLEYILSAYTQPVPNGAILFLDINMPVLTGWDVLDEMLKAPDAVKRQLRIYMLSSSIAPQDKQKAKEHPLVSGFIEKPLTIFQLNNLFPDLQEWRL